MIYREIMKLSTNPNTPIDLTKEVLKTTERCLIKEGTCNVFIDGTTAGIVLNEDDRMLYEDMKRLMDELADPKRLYHHPENAHSHLRAQLMAQSIVIPVAAGKLVLGDWQHILLWEFDTRPRERKIIITISD